MPNSRATRAGVLLPSGVWPQGINYLPFNCNPLPLYFKGHPSPSFTPPGVPYLYIQAGPILPHQPISIGYRIQGN